jgi:hypothetical protein
MGVANSRLCETRDAQKSAQGGCMSASNPAPLPDEIADRIGRLADTCDNIHSASLLPVGADFHLPILRSTLLDVRDELRQLHIAITGDDPWAS